MDSCQLIRKETKMEVVHLNQKQLADAKTQGQRTLQQFHVGGVAGGELHAGAGNLRIKRRATMNADVVFR